MSDSREDRMLNELLREVAQEDARLDGAGLEQQVMARWDAGEVARKIRLSRTAYWVIGAMAAAVLIAVLVLRVADLKVGTTGTSAAITPYPLPLTPDSLPLTPDLQNLRPAPAESAAVGRVARRMSSRPQRRPAETETLSFFPLVPMTGEELSGSFQIVRVQMPRASLDALATTSDMTNPAELIEADVLLGEDGMARAIRVSSNETGYPWRSR